MDDTTAKLVDYAMSVRYDALEPATVEACKQRVLDTLACIAGGYEHPVSTAARELAARYRMDTPATVLGSGARVAPEMAAFANGVMLRVLDLSDMYRVKSGGHPSDVIAATLAAAEIGARDGKAFIAATALAYEIYCACCEAIDLNSKGWDQPVYGAIACALAAGRLMDLTREQLGHAVSLALVPNMAMYQTRQGELSSWKGCAAANAARNALFAAMLARAGFTGPDAPFEGRFGLWDAVGRFEWPVEIGTAPRRIQRTHLKCFPICYHGQCAVWTAFALRDVVRVDAIEDIHIETYRTAFEMMANDPSRWAPQTHETADHSLPYVVAIALLDGAVDVDAFTPERLADARVHALLARTRVSKAADLDAQHPENAPTRITIRMQDGTQRTHEVRNPKGHDRNPLTEAEVEEKFRRLFRRYGTSAQADRVARTVGRLETLEDVGELIAVCTR